MNGNRLTGRQLFAKQLKRAREAKGMTQEALAKAVYKSPSLVAMWETGRRLPQPEDMGNVERALGSNGYLTELLTFATSEAPIEWFGKWLSIERQATSLLMYEPLVVPGLFQTEEYARALLQFSKQANFDLDHQVSARLERQRILGSDDPPSLVAVLDEAVLNRPIGDPKVAYEQFTHLAEIATQPNIVVQVIPFEVGEYAGLTGAFYIASLNGRQLAYLDTALSGLVIENPEEITEVKRRWDSLRGEALPKKASLKIIQEAAEKWR
ncbi:helix-turn-helix transcriptional regulator [uncultured Thermomonospora sp.]|uniref:helix-turn-helix domain-containing protein n=1 Tax=uncultured Thermomonospora sp. TaxID=671175 RepID=UPI00259B0325|nr:helix-turn-helix transcriptional regulator [uncultured Thermomonospora sp.]